MRRPLADKSDLVFDMFWCRTFRTEKDLVVAACDENLLERELSFNDFRVKVKKEFYGGKLVDEQIVAKLLKKATIGNILGKEIVAIAASSGLIEPDNLVYIDGIPHAQFVKL